MKAKYVVAGITALLIVATTVWWLTRPSDGVESSIPDAPSAVAEPNAGEWVVPMKEWSGVIRDNELHKLAPNGQMLADRRAWANLWTAWRVGEPVPNVDFASELVFVFTIGGPNALHAELRHAGGGRVNATQLCTLLDGPGFGYAILRVKRSGITSLEGRLLPDAG